jgi:lysyl-tRNA synthetase class 2
VARVLVLTAIWALLAYPLHRLTPHLYQAVWLVLDACNLPGVPSVFNCAALTLIASAIRHRKRIALWGVIVLIELPAVIYAAAMGVMVLVRADWRDWLYPALLADLTARGAVWRVAISGLTGLIAIVWLWAHRAEFRAPVAKGAAWRALLTLLGGLSVAWAWAFAWAAAIGPKSTSIVVKAWWAFNLSIGQGPEEIVLGADLSAYSAWDGLVSGALAPLWVVRSTSVVSTLALLAALAVFSRSGRFLRQLSLRQELRIRRLLAHYGDQDSLGYFNLRSDKSAVFSSDGQAAVVGRLVGGTLLASSDPVGLQSSWPDAIVHWIDLARRNGWTPAVDSATPRGGRAWEAAGLRALELGDEAIIAVDDFSLRDRRLRGVAEAARRARRAGYTVTIRRQNEVAAEELEQLADDATIWRQGSERGFAMTSGRIGDPADGRNIVVTAYGPDGTVRALLTLVPWGRRGISLDVMRRDPLAHAGVMELMVTSLAETCRDFGVQRISLNFAVLRRFLTRGAAVGAYPVARLARRLLIWLSHWWQVEGLYRANQKYDPEWKPRVVCFDRGASLTEVIAAMARAEGFLPDWPTGGVLPGKARQLGREIDADFLAAVEQIDAEAVEPLRPARRYSSQMAARMAHRAALAAAGMPPNPVAVPRTCSIGWLVEQSVDSLATPGQSGSSLAPPVPPPVPPPETEPICLVGRILRRRDHGGVIFIELREQTSELQVMLGRDQTKGFTLFKRHVQLGDVVSVSGRLIRTRTGHQPSHPTGQLTLQADSWVMAAKSIAPPPPKRRFENTWPRLTPAVVRSPHIMLAVNNRAAEMIRRRSAITTALRTALEARDFVEVETPILQPIHGGAKARPFRTHSNAYDIELYLRIAPELYLKRLAVGGIERVFEMGRNFRNEGVDGRHNPEFTALEAYQAFSDYEAMRFLAQDLITAAAVAVHGRPVALSPDGREVSLVGDWPVVPVYQAISEATGQEVTPASPLAVVRQIASRAAVTWRPDWPAGEIVTRLYDELVESRTFEPVFYKDFPLETSPLTRAHRSIPGLAERWDLVIFGAELGTAYSELTDPVDERARLTAQSAMAAAGDPEAMQLDEDFLSALDFGLVPTGGIGLGVDRVVMALTGTTIRRTVPFPFIRPTGRADS